MSEPIYLPIPVAVVTENITALENAYTVRRRTEGAETAFVAALRDVLDPKSQQVVVDAISGQWTAGFPGFDGPSFGRDMKRLFEDHYQILNNYQRRLDRRPTLGIVELAEDLATDPALSGRYLDSISRGGQSEADAIAREAVRVLVVKASEAITRVGRNVRLDQANAVVKKLGNKAAVALRSGDDAALAQAQWCIALHGSLNNERRR